MTIHNEIKVTVIIPLYNKRKHIRRAIDSVLAQTCQGFEIIVVDDGSTDGGETFVNKYNDPRIRLIDKPNGGPSSARNTGIAAASFDFVAFLDADDEWFPDFLEKIIVLIKKYPEASVYASSYYYNNGRRIQKKKLRDQSMPPGWDGFLEPETFFTYGTPWHPSSVAIKKSILNLTGGFDESLRLSEDTHLWRRLAILTKIAYLNMPLAEIYLNSENRSDFEANMETGRYDYDNFGFPEVLAVAENLDPASRQQIIQRVEAARIILRKNQSLVRPPTLIRKFYDLSDNYQPLERGRKILPSLVWVRLIIAVWGYPHFKLAHKVLFTLRIVSWVVKVVINPN